MKEKSKPNAGVENQLRQAGFTRIAGVDEAGLGALAGPVVAAAVVFNHYHEIPSLTDSKQLSAKKREELYSVIQQRADSIGVGIIPVSQINKLNVYWAGRLAMKTAVQELSPDPDYVIIDGNKLLDITIPQQAIIKGDSKCISIAAASVIAKVTRDCIMAELSETYPQYQWYQNKGYGTKAHKDLIEKYGPCSAHRVDFKGVKEYL